MDVCYILGYWFSVTHTLTWNYIFHGPVILPYILKTILWKTLKWDIGSMWCKDLPNEMYVGQWPTFHGPVILFCFFSWRLLLDECFTGLIVLVWYKLWSNILCRCPGLWPIFHGTVNLPYILNTIRWASLILLALWNIYGSLAYTSWFIGFDFSLSRFVEVRYENVWQCSMVRILGQWFTQSVGRGHQCTLDTFLVEFLQKLASIRLFIKRFLNSQ